MVKPQSGTWSSSSNVQEQDILKIPSIGDKFVSDAQGATMTVGRTLMNLIHVLINTTMHVKVNPPTAYNMLRDFVKLERGDWVVQNGANSAVCCLSFVVHIQSTNISFH